MIFAPSQRHKILMVLILCISLLGGISACAAGDGTVTANVPRCTGVVINSCNSDTKKNTSSTTNNTSPATNNTASIPQLASIYQGTLIDITLNATSTLTLTSITQHQDGISGHIGFGDGWIGNGPNSMVLNSVADILRSAVAIKDCGRSELYRVINSLVGFLVSMDNALSFYMAISNEWGNLPQSVIWIWLTNIGQNT